MSGQPGRGGGRRSAPKRAPNAGFIVCTSWLENEFPKKLLMVETWEQVKLLTSGVPHPPKVSAVSYGIDAFTPERAVEVATENFWHQSYFDKVLTTEDCQILSKGAIEGYAATIAARSDAHANGASAAGAKRPRIDGAASADGASGVMPPAISLPTFPASNPGNSAPAGDMDDADLSALGIENNTPYEPPASPVQAPESVDILQMHDQMNEMQGQLAQIKTQMEAYERYQAEMMSAIFHPNSIGLFNLPMKPSEGHDDYKDRIKKLLTGLGFPNEAENLSNVTIQGKLSTVLLFHSPLAADMLLGHAARFHTQYWADKPEAKEVISNLTALKDQCLHLVKHDRVTPKRGGYLHIARWRRMDGMRGATRSQPPAPAPVAKGAWN